MSKINTLDQTARSAANKRMGDFSWPTVFLGLTVMAAYLATPLMVAYGYLSVIVALPMMIVLTYAAYTVLHEAVHGTISGSHSSLRWVNEAMGYCAGWIIMVPLTAHRHEHLTHHRNTNQPEHDPDYVVSDMARTPFHAVRAALRILRGQYTHYIQHKWATAPKSQNQRFCMEIAAIVLLRVAIIAQGYWLESSLLFLLGSLGGITLIMYLFAYIVHRPHAAVGRYVDTSTIVMPGFTGKLLTVLWGFQNYHSIHHLFPRVPFYKYRVLFDEIEDIMVAKGAPIYHLTALGLKPRDPIELPAI